MATNKENDQKYQRLISGVSSLKRLQTTDTYVGMVQVTAGQRIKARPARRAYFLLTLREKRFRDKTQFRHLFVGNTTPISVIVDTHTFDGSDRLNVETMGSYNNVSVFLNLCDFVIFANVQKVYLDPASSSVLSNFDQ
jgi:hypothetical protein